MKARPVVAWRSCCVSEVYSTEGLDGIFTSGNLLELGDLISRVFVRSKSGSLLMLGVESKVLLPKSCFLLIIGVRSKVHPCDKSGIEAR